MSQNTPINVTLNGERRELPGATSVAALLERLGVATDLVAVEVNRELVRKRDFQEHLLGDGDQVEVVEFVGGG
ncbi:MAG TPA: sulfur carrier protein ThiS [Thermoanaerobaculia bacterium]